MNLITQDTIAQELTGIGARFTPLGLELPPGTTFEQWSEIGKKIQRCSESFNWWIGDFLAYGDRAFGKLKEFCELNGYNYSTLRILSYVSENVKMLIRRNNLSWTHHREVAHLPPKLQVKWLDAATQNHWSVSQLRVAIRTDGPGALFDAHASDGPIMRWPQDQPLDKLIPWLQERPADFWTDETKFFWREKLKPAAKIYQTLCT